MTSQAVAAGAQIAEELMPKSSPPEEELVVPPPAANEDERPDYVEPMPGVRYVPEPAFVEQVVRARSRRSRSRSQKPSRRRSPTPTYQDAEMDPLINLMQERSDWKLYAILNGILAVTFFLIILWTSSNGCKANELRAQLAHALNSTAEACEALNQCRLQLRDSEALLNDVVEVSSAWSKALVGRN